MKIGIYCTNNVTYPLPPSTIYASMDIAGTLADGLVDQGHDVTFFAPEGSKTKAKLVTFGMEPFGNPTVYEKLPHGSSSFEYENIMMAQALNYAEEHNFEIFHSHARPFSTLSYAALKPNLPIAVTIHDPLDDDAFKILPNYKIFTNIHYISISNAQRTPLPTLNWASTVYNGIDENIWQLNDSSKRNYIFYAGRIMPNKGVDIAVDFALANNLPIKIAGNIYDSDKKWFDETIKPHIDSGKPIEYLGIVEREDLPRLYQGALATAMPVRWNEPFGLVAIESLAAGTPVIASSNGSLPEIVNLENGYVLQDYNVNEYKQALQHVLILNNSEIRKDMVKRFGIDQMIKNYANTYINILKNA